MTEENERALVVAAEAFGNVAAPLKTPFLKTLGQLLGGLTAIPTSWLKRPVQAYEDTTTGRSQVAAALAKAVAEQAVADPEIMQAATELYLPAAIKKGRNKVQVALRAAEHVASDSGDATNAAPPDEDWLNLFARFAEDASSERLQDLFGRILAGQVTRPGSFAAATLRAVSELDQAIAGDFTAAWARSVGKGVHFSDYWQRGDGFSLWKRLSEAGLMAPSNIVQFPPPFQPIFNGCGLWAPMQTSAGWVHVLFQQGTSATWPHIEFTRVGREIGSILPAPNYEANLREAAQLFPKQGIARIELHMINKPVETIFQAA
jgi:hypothetical protein